MKNKLLVFILAGIFTLFATSSCQHRYPASLVEADSLICSDPKVALLKLDSISLRLDTAEKTDMMYLLLLKMTVKDKLYMPFGTLDSVQNLVKFYEKEDSYLLPRAYYLLGRWLYELHDAPQAFTYYHKVLDLLDADDDIRLRGSVCSQVGYMMRDQGDFQQAIEFFNKAYKCYSLVSDSKRMAVALRDIAIIEMSLNNSRMSLSCLHKALKIANNVDENVQNDIKLQLANYYIYYTNRLDSVKSYLSSPLQANRNYEEMSVNLLASEYYWAIEKPDSSKFYLSQLLERGNVCDKQEAANRLLKIYAYEEDSDKSLFYLNLYLEYGDSIKAINRMERKQNGLALFNYASQQEHIQTLRLENLHKIIGIIFLIFLCFVISFILIVYWNMGVVRKLQLKNKLNELRFFALDDKKTSLHQELKESISLGRFLKDEMHFSDTDWSLLDFKVNQIYPGFKDKLYTNFTLSDNEYHICLLVKIGVATKEIAMLTSHTRQAVSMAKQRLYKKITNEKGKADDLDEFLKNL